MIAVTLFLILAIVLLAGPLLAAAGGMAPRPGRARLRPSPGKAPPPTRNVRQRGFAAARRAFSGHIAIAPAPRRAAAAPPAPAAPPAVPRMTGVAAKIGRMIEQYPEKSVQVVRTWMIQNGGATQN